MNYVGMTLPEIKTEYRANLKLLYAAENNQKKVQHLDIEDILEKIATKMMREKIEVWDGRPVRAMSTRGNTKYKRKSSKRVCHTCEVRYTGRGDQKYCSDSCRDIGYKKRYKKYREGRKVLTSSQGE